MHWYRIDVPHASCAKTMTIHHTCLLNCEFSNETVLSVTENYSISYNRGKKRNCAVSASSAPVVVVEILLQLLVTVNGRHPVVVAPRLALDLDADRTKKRK